MTQVLPSKYRNGNTLSNVLAILNDTIPNSNWFIAGGFAVNQNNYHGIDVYFTDETAYTEALDALQIFMSAYYRSYTIAAPPPIITKFSTTYNLASDLYSDFLCIQLIKVRYGTVDEILDGFDLCCCMKAILPDGSIYVGSRYTDDIRINVDSIGQDLYRRIIKYIAKGFYLDVHKISKNLENILKEPNRLSKITYEETLQVPYSNIFQTMVNHYLMSIKLGWFKDDMLYDLNMAIEMQMDKNPEYFV